MRTEKELIQIYEQYVDTVYRVCFMFLKRNRADVEDAVQTTFLQLMRSGAEFVSAAHERAWLIVTASNICKNMLSSPWKRRVTVTDDMRLCEEEAASDQTLESVLELPDKYKTAIYMFYYEGYSADDIARAMGKSRNSVWGYLHKGRKLLKEKLTEGER